ncbi:hypothetical protein GCM10023156_33330 [Novipirellula rosea]|uniref:Uncharacterized protein n=1 Tax=Novipirellula rosea TaxID=1031540 RepID=A0ABP8MW25_9BACT
MGTGGSTAATRAIRIVDTGIRTAGTGIHRTMVTAVIRTRRVINTGRTIADDPLVTRPIRRDTGAVAIMDTVADCIWTSAASISDWVIITDRSSPIGIVMRRDSIRRGRLLRKAR